MSESEYNLALKAIREKLVRQGVFEPRNEDEERQAREGPKPNSELDCVKDKSGTFPQSRSKL